MQIKWAEQYGTGQIYNNGAEVAMTNAALRQIGPFVYCKDFLQDAITGFINKKAVNVHGYQYTPGVDPALDFDKARVLFTNSALPTLESKLTNIQDFVSRIEDLLSLASSEHFHCENPPAKYTKCGVSYWEGSPLWLAAPPLLSLWTLLIRNGSVHTIGNEPMDTIDQIVNGKLKAGQHYDPTYLKMGKIGLKFMIERGIGKCFGFKEDMYLSHDDYRMNVLKANYPDSAKVSTLHHYGGIVSYSESHATTKELFSNWTFPEAGVIAPGFCHS